MDQRKVKIELATFTIAAIWAARKMKIVVLTQFFLPEMGAPQTRLYELCQGLQQLGWQVEVVTAMPNYPNGKIADGYRTKFSCTEQADFVIHRYWLYASNSQRTLPRIVSMLSF